MKVLLFYAQTTFVKCSFIFQTLISGNFPVTMIDNDYIFIDRDPELFPYIANYQRNWGSLDKYIVELSKDKEDLVRLKNEANYFGVQGLIDLIDGNIGKCFLFKDSSIINGNLQKNLLDIPFKDNYIYYAFNELFNLQFNNKKKRNNLKNNLKNKFYKKINFKKYPKMGITICKECYNHYIDTNKDLQNLNKNLIKNKIYFYKKPIQKHIFKINDLIYAIRIKDFSLFLQLFSIIGSTSQEHEFFKKELTTSNFNVNFLYYLNIINKDKLNIINKEFILNNLNHDYLDYFLENNNLDSKTEMLNTLKEFINKSGEDDIYAKIKCLKYLYFNLPSIAKKFISELAIDILLKDPLHKLSYKIIDRYIFKNKFIELNEDIILKLLKLEFKIIESLNIQHELPFKIIRNLFYYMSEMMELNNRDIYELLYLEFKAFTLPSIEYLQMNELFNYFLQKKKEELPLKENTKDILLFIILIMKEYVNDIDEWIPLLFDVKENIYYKILNCFLKPNLEN
ncbi:hypothetical protein ABK040_001412 [Willaertia magna]